VFCLKSWIKIALAGLTAGAINGLFGAGGGMIMVSALGFTGEFQQEEVFPASVSIILPACLVSLSVSGLTGLPWRDSAPYLVGSVIGGVLAGVWGKYIPVKYMHRFLGLLILYGGFRYLW
jgi:uncharacterized membrane protein YfcA